MIASVVDLVEEHVCLGGSPFSESIFERWFFACFSQWNVVVREFRSPCLPQFFHELSHCQCWQFRPHEKLQGHLVLQLCLCQVALIYHELDLELVGLVGRILLVEQLPLLVVELSFSGCRSTLEPSSSVQSGRGEIFGGGRGDMYAFSIMTSPVFSPTTFGIHQAEVFLEGWLHSIESDRMSILSEWQDRCRPNIPRLWASSMRYASFVQDMAHSSQSFQDLYALCPWDQQTERILFVSCSNSDLQELLQSWW